MSGRFSIHPAPPDMAPALAALHGECFGAESWSAEQIKGSLALATTRGWVAQDENQPVGFLLCQFAGDEIEILTLCVTPARRRGRIADALLRHMMETAQAKGGKKIFLEVAADNIAARRLYEGLNFTVTGTRANYYKRGAATVDGVMYQHENQ